MRKSFTQTALIKLSTTPFVTAPRPFLSTRAFSLVASLPRMSDPVKRTHSPPQSPATASDSKKLKLEEAPLPDAAPATVASDVSATTVPLESSAPAVAPVATATPTAASVSAGTSNGKPKGNKRDKRKGRKVKAHKAGGAEETGMFDVIELLGEERYDELMALAEEGRDWTKEAQVEWGMGGEGKDVEVEVVGMSAHGDGLARLTPANQDKPTRLVAIPFTLPGEKVRVHVHRHEPDFFMSHADLLEIITPSPSRALLPDESAPSGLQRSLEKEEISPELAAVRAKYGPRVECKYFGVCSGCQYQPLSYADQLTLKQSVVRKAFANFSGLDGSLIPEVGPTLPSPLQYSYRTKLTPHFQAPPLSGKSTGGRKGQTKAQAALDAADDKLKDWEVTIGFEQKGRKRIVDIEECVIATKVINDSMTREREAVKANIGKYKRGATLLLRDSLPPRSADYVKPAKGEMPKEEAHVVITDHHATVREQIESLEFEQMAGSFFQNNNSILPSLLRYIADSIPPRVEGTKTYLIDTYCGSGLFGIALADRFDRVEGVEIDKNSIKWAKQNAAFNEGEGRGQIGFRDGKAEAIFGTIDFPPDETTILIDPPRKGCDELFLKQLLAFNPKCVIYVSCNVHTQARDVGFIVKESQKKAQEEGKKEGGGFRIESVRAADLFSQTHHAEGLCILRRD